MELSSYTTYTFRFNVQGELFEFSLPANGEEDARYRMKKILQSIMEELEAGIYEDIDELMD